MSKWQICSAYGGLLIGTPSEDIFLLCSDGDTFYTIIGEYNALNHLHINAITDNKFSKPISIMNMGWCDYWVTKVIAECYNV